MNTINNKYRFGGGFGQALSKDNLTGINLFIQDLDTSCTELGLLITSFVSDDSTKDDFKSIPYLTKLIQEVEDCINGDSDIGAGWGNEMASVGTGKEMTKVWSNLSDNSQGEIPTSEILQLLKDWKVFLEKFYSLGWGVVKEDIKEEARSKYIKE